jgi:hypothetical protein
VHQHLTFLQIQKTWWNPTVADTGWSPTSREGREPSLQELAVTSIYTREKVKVRFKLIIPEEEVM